MPAIKMTKPSVHVQTAILVLGVFANRATATGHAGAVPPTCNFFLQALHVLHLEKLLCQICCSQVLLDSCIHVLCLEPVGQPHMSASHGPLTWQRHMASIQGLRIAAGLLHSNDLDTRLAR